MVCQRTVGPRRAIPWRAIVLCLVGLVCCAPAVPGEDATTIGRLEWRTGAVFTGQQDPTTLADALRATPRAGARHVVVQFSRPLTPAERAQADAAGIRLLNYVGDNAFFAAIAADKAGGVAAGQLAALRCVLPIERNWKLHPDFVRGSVPPWAIVSETKEGTAQTKAQVKSVAVYVLFHPDVPLAEGIALCQQQGAVVRSTLESINGLVVELPLANVASLADADGVEWIEPPLPKFSEVNDDNRSRTGANTVNAAPYNLNGTGVTVLVYDGGYGRATHQDFGGRLHVRDTSGLSDHSTHVAGTIGGSGVASSGTYRGMAPGVTLEAYGFEQEGGLQQGFLYTDPGDLQADYSQAISTYGADIANNSIGTNTAPNGYPCEWEGNYGATDVLIDTIVRGDGSNPLFTQPFRIIWANGNERQVTTCLGVEGFPSPYHSTAPPACAKNHITVGALNSNDDSVTDFTSFGPADDGRLKPDISAPGCQSNGDEGVTSCSSSGDSAYVAKCGTSMAAPTVCGLSALLLQDFRQQYPTKPDFRNSTLKVLLAHTAVDVFNAGPDYQTGYGSVRIQAAVDLMRSGHFLEDTVSQAGVSGSVVIVSPGDTTLKVTLAWDDVPGTPNVNPVLVNDLDLRVFDANNTQYYPWTLDKTIPSQPAVRTQADHINNIEQVVINSPTPGAYRVEVYGYNVPSGPQPFSLCATPVLVKCSHAGTITLDRAKYACTAQATLRVVDCDLNTSDTVVDTVSVTIASTSEAAGETVLLTESAAASATFLGTIDLSTTDAAGTLLIAPGDTVTATYTDVDNGQGGTNVPVTATATVDCQPPAISNVQVSPLNPRDATITLATDEPAQVTVHYGLSCTALTGSQSAAGFNTTHSISLSGLTDNCTYYFAITAVDQAGNSITDDAGGACYSFTTPEVPDYFTQLFTSGNDLDNLSLVFTPNSSVDFYSGCAVPITALPTDPNGGTTLTFSPSNDDGYASVNPGATVSLYGTNYTSFYVGSNGYITFTSGDSTTGESYANHFNQPRISGVFDDLNPGAGGSVSWKKLSDRVAVTWRNVPEYNTSNQNTFQIELFFDGKIVISYLVLAASDGLAGLSHGGGVPSDFLATDLSILSCGPRPPVADAASALTNCNTPVTITLSANDDGLPNPPAALTYVITALPSHGRLSDPGAGSITTVPYALAGYGDQVTYRPKPYYSGADSFTYRANDGGTAPDGGDSNTATVSVTIGGTQCAYNFPLDTNPGWTTQGQWAFGTPTGAGDHNHDPTSGHTGNNVYGYKLTGNYDNNMPVYYLTTTALDCSTLTNVQLRFWRWLGVESGACCDHADLAVSKNGTSWTTIWNHTSTSAIADTVWVQQTYDISAVADQASTVYIRWGMGPTDSSVTYPGWNIDDIELWGAESPDPTGDMNCDGVISYADINPFVLAIGNAESYQAQYPDCDVLYADCNHDGVVSYADINPFVALLAGR